MRPGWEACGGPVREHRCPLLLLQCFPSPTHPPALSCSPSFSVELGEEAKVETAAAIFKRFCYNYRDQISAGIICAGYDKHKGGQVGTPGTTPPRTGNEKSLDTPHVSHMYMYGSPPHSCPAGLLHPPWRFDNATALCYRRCVQCCVEGRSLCHVVLPPSSLSRLTFRVLRPHLCSGSGSTFIYGFCDSAYREGMTKDECLDFVRKSELSVQQGGRGKWKVGACAPAGSDSAD